MTFRERVYVHLTTLAVIAIILLMIWLIGLKAYLMIQIPVFLYFSRSWSLAFLCSASV